MHPVSYRKRNRYLHLGDDLARPASQGINVSCSTTWTNARKCKSPHQYGACFTLPFMLLKLERKLVRRCIVTRCRRKDVCRDMAAMRC